MRQQWSGIAIAVYERSNVVLNPHRVDEAIGGTVIGGVAVDGGGAIVINGVPHPVDPWGPLVVALVNASLVSAGSRGMTHSVGAHVRQLAALAVLHSIKQAIPNIEKEAGGKL